MSVKTVDISTINQATADELIECASRDGFLFLEGSGFTQKEVDDLFNMSKGYFALPLEEKNKFHIGPENHGYSGVNVETLDPATQKKGDPKEAFNIGKYINEKPVQPMPEFFMKPENDEIITNMMSKLYNLAQRLLKLLAMGLKIDEKEGGSNWFAERHRRDYPSGSLLRLLYYPGQKKTDPEDEIRAGAHTDYGSVTLLFHREGEEGLEILSPVTKKWEPVPFVGPKEPGMAPPIVVNIGDLLSYWTAGVLKSTVHRVKFPAKLQAEGTDRYSFVFFTHPEEEVKLEPVPSAKVAAITGRGANEGKVITAEEHLQSRLSATYGWKK
ncbi:UPF0676 protein [Yarrowia sp. C11]|nr:UPF0676 protein [Yarrowia sp. E02]KAG5372186.1 UPF0676 protein [Yarrowia sp. C11]